MNSNRNSNRYLLALAVCLFMFIGQTSAQIKADSAFQAVDEMVDFLWNRDHDTTYITSYNDRYNVRLLGIGKFTFFRINDKKNNSSLFFTPELGLNFGVGLTYNWFSIDLAFNMGLRQNNIPDSRYFDFQGNVFSSKFLFEGTLKYYYGYELNNTTGLDESVITQIRPDIRTINFGLSFLYALRYDKFSLKAPFVFSEVQRKSAGSPIFGAGFTAYTIDADSSIVSQSVADQFSEPLRSLTGMNMLSLTLNVGYIYSVVYKERIFMSLGIIPGISFTAGDYTTGTRENRDLYVSGMTKMLLALGYNGSRWYGGVQLIADFDGYRLDKKMQLLASHGKSKFYLGYRIHK